MHPHATPVSLPSDESVPAAASPSWATLLAGNTLFWLAYSLASTATRVPSVSAPLAEWLQAWTLTTPQGTRIEQARMTLTGTMRTMEHGAPVLDRLNVDLQYIHHKDDHFRRRMQTRSVFFFYDFDDVAGISATPVAARQDDYARIDAAAYDPAFWRDHPVLARTPTDRAAIASFERTGAFGRLADALP